NVLGAAHAFLEEAHEVGRGLPGTDEANGDETSEAEHDGDEGDAKQGDDEADPPVDAKEQEDDADGEQGIAEDVEDELGEEVPEQEDVAVDAFDQRAGRVTVVELHVQVEHMLSEVGAHLVGGGPADVFRGPGFAEADDLDEEGGADVDTGEDE